MIHATIGSTRPKMCWKDIIKTEMDYLSIIATGLQYTLFDEFPSREEWDEYLKGKEKSNESNHS